MGYDLSHMSATPPLPHVYRYCMTRSGVCPGGSWLISQRPHHLEVSSHPRNLAAQATTMLQSAPPFASTHGGL